MRKLEISLTQEQFEHIQEEIKYSNRINISKGVLGGCDLCLHVSVPNFWAEAQKSE